MKSARDRSPTPDGKCRFLEALRDSDSRLPGNEGEAISRIEEASKLCVDAPIDDQAEIPPLVSLYASINKIRVISNPGIAERADNVARIIVDTCVLPNKSFLEVRAMMQTARWTLCATSSRLATKNFLFSLPEPSKSNIVAREPISSIESAQIVLQLPVACQHYRKRVGAGC
jgi:hypothetical protein